MVPVSPTMNLVLQVRSTASTRVRREALQDNCAVCAGSMGRYVQRRDGVDVCVPCFEELGEGAFNIAELLRRTFRRAAVMGAGE